ncbi:MAG TPA: asparagine synthase (glutamine-hydrolyzing) [Burkholderiales bacterium]|nr:asparagine synthase (glutamine-hydrolyzing) [Burkholderiales bacterium]
MCGILGIVGTRWRSSAPAALDTIASRGPDALETIDLGEAWLGHARLAVIDVAGGRQPMASPDGRYTILYNGEIFNFQALRAELERAGHAFATRSDTEVLLHGYAAWGPGLPQRLDGMFAFAIWDARGRKLFAARDRIGIKPFFYALTGGTLAFASTLAPFLALQDFPRRMDMEALRDYLAFQTVLAPRTFLADVRQLPPASSLAFDAATQRLTVQRYWEIPSPGPAPALAEERVALVDAALRESVRRQLVSDVPLGAFLSGGIDSGLMVRYMAEAGAKPLRTFNVRFREEGFDETPHARAVALAFGAEHTVIDAPAMDGSLLAQAVGQLDQPLADPAYLATNVLSRLTRSAVTVAVSGDGGDELFAGYPRFREVEAGFPDSSLRRLTRVLVRRGMLPGALLRRGLAGRDMLLYRRVELGPFDPSRKGLGRFLSADALARCRPGDTMREWLDLASRWGEPIGTSALMRADLWTYLSEDCLVKTDRASMAHGLEVRVPFLGNPVLDLVLGWPAEIHFDADGGKALLRAIARRTLPESAWNRPKHGFSVPLLEFFNGPWRAVGDAQFERTAEIAPFLNASAVRELWRRACAGRASRRLAFTMLVLLLWLERHNLAFD